MPARIPLPEPELRLGVACDEAFNFHYRENFDLLRQLGVEPVGFSPLRQPELPGDLDGLWFGGGFPELYAQELAANAAMLDSIRSFAASGRPVYGECGGYLYLLEALTGFDGVRHPLLGLLPGEAVMRDRGSLRSVTARSKPFPIPCSVRPGPGCAATSSTIRRWWRSRAGNRCLPRRICAGTCVRQVRRAETSAAAISICISGRTRPPRRRLRRA